MRVLHFAGPSGSGKTRLIEALIPLLPVVQVIKWTHHALPSDPPQSDTGRFAKLGPATLLAAPNGIVDRRPPSSRESVYQTAAAQWHAQALVIVEGDKGSPRPKIWIGRDLPPVVLSVRGVIGPQRPPGSIPWFDSPVPLPPDSIKQIAAHLAQEWMRYSYEVRGGQAQ